MLRYLLEVRTFISKCIKISFSSSCEKYLSGRASLKQLNTGTSVLKQESINPFFFFFLNGEENRYFSMYIQRSIRAVSGPNQVGSCKLPLGFSLKEMRSHCRVVSREVILSVFHVHGDRAAQLRTHCREAGIMQGGCYSYRSERWCGLGQRVS